MTVLTYEFDDLRMSVNDLEQYGRRNYIRIKNFKVDSPLGPPSNEQEMTAAMANFLNTAVFKGDSKLTERDIERYHFIGKPKASKTQQIIVIFFPISPQMDGFL